MCWSAEADLVAGGAVAALGVVALTRVRRWRELPLALLPLLLGVHQLVEAMVWRGADGELGSGPAGVARTLWAVIAYPLLPAFVPLAVLPLAARSRRPLVLLCAALGLATSAVLAVAVAGGPVTAFAQGHTLRYGLAVPAPVPLAVAYVLATVGSLVGSGQRDIRNLGLACGVGAAVSLTLWETAFVSTWCALAALSSLLILRWLHRAHRTPEAGAVA